MRRVIALQAAVSLLIALMYAPLFHVHTDLAGGPLFHAHVPEAEHEMDETVVHMESQHSHSSGRSVDVLTSTIGHGFEFSPVILSVSTPLDPADEDCGFAPVATPRSHAPPDASVRIPRAPPFDVLA